METPEKSEPKDHPLYKKVYELSSCMHNWLEQNKPGEVSIEETENLILEKEKNHMLFDAIEVIYFYNFSF